MSSMERNKGTLIPYTHKLTDDMYEEPWEYGLMFVNDVAYNISYEIEAETENDGFSHATVREDGRIDFHTHHYNGGAGLQEVIEAALDKED